MDFRKHRIAPASDNPDVDASIATYSTALPMNLSTCFFMYHPTPLHPPSPSLLTLPVPHHSPTSSLPPPSTTRYPFNIRLATVKLQLTSFAIKDPETGQSITLRPDFRRDKDADSSMVTIKSAESLDNSIMCVFGAPCALLSLHARFFGASRLTPFLRFPSHTLHRYGLVTSAPVIFGELDKMQSTKGKETIEWTPTVVIGFWVFEPAIASIIYMLGAPRRQRAQQLCGPCWGRF